MAEQDSEKSLVEQYEIGEDPISSSSTAVETSEVTATVESPRQLPPRDESGQFTKPITPDQNIPAHPAYLVSMAKKAGFTQEEIQGIPPEALALAIEHVHETRIAARHEARIEQSRQPEAMPRDAPIPPQREDPFELPAEEFDDKLVALLKRQDRELKSLKSEVAQLRNAEVFRQNETLTQKVDRLFSKQPKERFGEGPGKKLGKDSAEMKRRLAVLREMETIKSGDVEEDFEKAVTTLYGKQLELVPTPNRELESRKEEWNRSGLSRPTHRNGAPEPKGVAKAESSVNEILRDMGSAGSDDSTSIDEFLGE